MCPTCLSLLDTAARVNTSTDLGEEHDKSKETMREHTQITLRVALAGVGGDFRGSSWTQLLWLTLALAWERNVVRAKKS